MVIVYDYEIVKKENRYYIKARKPALCSICHRRLRVRGSKKRYMITESGEKLAFQLRRLCCEYCGKTHIEFPNIMVPHKHYSYAAIKNAMKSPYSDCGAENSTIQRWRSEWT